MKCMGLQEITVSSESIPSLDFHYPFSIQFLRLFDVFCSQNMKISFHPYCFQHLSDHASNPQMYET